jgi:glycosyltransferase involved in cell wall biosynthesis
MTRERRSRPTILVVGQTPPPFGGQAVMIEALLQGRYERIVLAHVRMAFSREMSDVGKVQASKLGHLLSVIASIYRQRLRTGARTLYYPPAGPDRVPMYRDLAILLSTRWLFEHTVWHFHGSGLSELYPRLSWPVRWLFRRAYFHPDAAIRISASSPPDGAALEARREYVIPNGVADLSLLADPVRRALGAPRLLFVGVLRESKGARVLLEALAILAGRSIPFEADLMGRFESQQFEAEIRHYAADHGLDGCVHFLGVRSGGDKARAYAAADIFCFPSFFESENFPVVLLEAMQFRLPVVATAWRGIPSLVRDGETGLLVPIKDPLAVADAVQRLIADPALAQRMGAAGRGLYERQYTIDAFHRRMEQALYEIASGTVTDEFHATQPE